MTPDTQLHTNTKITIRLLTVARQQKGSAECLATSSKSTEEYDHLSVA